MFISKSMGPEKELADADQPLQKLVEVATTKAHYTLRSHRPGDIGWIISRHGEMYAKEYGWNSEFEALVAEIGSGFLRHYDPERERCWIAERCAPAGQRERIGSILLAKETEDVAKLRLLLVEPAARDNGLGLALIDECLGFARTANYKSVSLWTQSNLVAARRLYEQVGFQIVHTAAHRSFGHDLIEEVWRLELGGTDRPSFADERRPDNFRQEKD